MTYPEQAGSAYSTNDDMASGEEAALKNATANSENLILHQVQSEGAIALGINAIGDVSAGTAETEHKLNPLSGAAVGVHVSNCTVTPTEVLTFAAAVDLTFKGEIVIPPGYALTIANLAGAANQVNVIWREVKR